MCPKRSLKVTVTIFDAEKFAFAWLEGLFNWIKEY